MSSSGISQPRKMRGWLKKVSGIVNKTWVARFFVLTGESLDYYSSEECAKMLGTIALADTRVREVAHDTEKYAFEIRAASEKQKSSSGHESYVLAASNANDRQSWITALRRTIHYAGGCFGRPLAEQMKIEKLASVLKRRGSDFETPLIVRRCLDFLIEHNAVERDGIFRVGGRIKVQRDLRDEFDHGVDVDFARVQDCGVAEVSSLLKSYLQSLPDSLIPAQYFDRVAPLGCQIQTLAQQKEAHDDAESEKNERVQANERIEELMSSLKQTLSELPFDSFNLLHAIMHFLWLIHSHAETNRMTAANLAITCWQVILKPEDSTAEMMEIVADISIRTVTIMIERFRDLFGQDTCDAVRERHDSELQSDGRLHLSADVIRSPSAASKALNRHQSLFEPAQTLPVFADEHEPGNGKPTHEQDSTETDAKQDGLSLSAENEAYRTLKSAYSDLARQNFDLHKQVEQLQEQVERYKLKYGALD